MKTILLAVVLLLISCGKQNPGTVVTPTTNPPQDKKPQEQTLLDPYVGKYKLTQLFGDPATGTVEVILNDSEMGYLVIPDKGKSYRVVSTRKETTLKQEKTKVTQEWKGTGENHTLIHYEPKGSDLAIDSLQCTTVCMGIDLVATK